MRTLLLAIIAAVVPAAAFAAAPSKPNIVFILADDLGLDGVGCTGSDTHKTPNIDALAKSGTRFETAYAAPLCGPCRCLLMTGRYAFRTGGLKNSSWQQGGPGAKSADEFPMAKVLKQAGYSTCMAGKWRQVGETPADWGFDEFSTDPTAGGWYWQNKHLRKEGEFTAPEGSYAPDIVHEYATDFIKRHKDGPFFVYYAMHSVHGPILKTSDSAPNSADLYEDNIRYMDKQVGAVVKLLEDLKLREKTLVIFSADNGTALNSPSPIGGRMINGKKASMLEGGSRVPFIASWPGVTPAGKVSKDMISLADPHATFAELAGVTLPPNIKFDGVSFAPQLRGEAGSPRKYAYVQLGPKWFVREAGFKMNESAELFDMRDAPFVEKLIPASEDSSETRIARQRLSGVLAELNPAAGKQDDQTTPKAKNPGKKAGRAAKKAAANKAA